MRLQDVFPGQVVSIQDLALYKNFSRDVDQALSFPSEELMEFMEGELINDMYEKIVMLAGLHARKQRVVFAGHFMEKIRPIIEGHQPMLNPLANIIDDDWETQEMIWNAVANSVAACLKEIAPGIAATAMIISRGQILPEPFAVPQQ